MPTFKPKKVDSDEEDAKETPIKDFAIDQQIVESSQNNSNILEAGTGSPDARRDQRETEN